MGSGSSSTPTTAVEANGKPAKGRTGNVTNTDTDIGRNERTQVVRQIYAPPGAPVVIYYWTVIKRQNQTEAGRELLDLFVGSDAFI